VTKRLRLIVAVALISPLGQPRAATFGPPGSQTAAACASCHLQDGQGSGIPPIAGLTESRIAEQMFGYRASEARSQIMYVVANALTLREITDVAHYIAEQPPAVKQR
jgi:cytochrome c553